MLAQSFKSADELRISDVEHRSLLTVLKMLETEELVHGDAPHARQSRRSNEFNMAATLDEGCGTIGCIAGWAYVVSSGDAFPEIIGEIEDWGLRANGALTKLFGISRCYGALYSITPAQAATALRSYLTTGDARWDLAVAG